MEYGVVTARTAKELQQAVNQLIQKGWIPLGGISAVPVSHSYLRNGAYHNIKVDYLQAMVRQTQ